MTGCDVTSYTAGVCHLISNDPLQTITAPMWMKKTPFSMLPIKAPDLHFTFDNLNGITNSGANLVYGKVSNVYLITGGCPIIIL